MGLAVDDWIWILIGASIAAVLWILWQGRFESTIEQQSERDEKLQKLFEELK